MRFQEVHLDDLVPTDYSEMTDFGFSDLPKLVLSGEVDPITVIEYRGKYIIGDGHTRAMLYWTHGILTVKVKVLETDQEIDDCGDGLFWRFSTRHEFLRDYNRNIKRKCQRRELNSIKDYANWRNPTFIKEVFLLSQGPPYEVLE